MSAEHLFEVLPIKYIYRQAQGQIYQSMDPLATILGSLPDMDVPGEDHVMCSAVMRRLIVLTSSSYNRS